MTDVYSRKNSVVWESVDWGKTNSHLALITGKSISRVAQMRKKLKKPKVQHTDQFSAYRRSDNGRKP